jgi:multicomponent K+:H+ antiporter subunit F
MTAALVPLAQPLAFTAALVQYTIDFGIVVVFAGMLLCVARLLKGPHLADRAIAADTLATHLMALLVLFTVRGGTLLLFDGVVVLALLGFLTSVAFAQHILRPYARRARQARGESDATVAAAAKERP